MPKKTVSLFVATGFFCALGAVAARGHEGKRPPGPMHDRHELMEGIGKNAKVIGEAMKAGKYETVPAAADKIEAASKKVLALFPPNTLHEHSRAKPEIWTN